MASDMEVTSQSRTEDTRGPAGLPREIERVTRTTGRSAGNPRKKEVTRMNGKQCSVLVVSPDSSVAESLAQSLKGCGHSVLVSGDACHAARIMEFRAFDVLLVDMSTEIDRKLDLVSYARCICPRPRIAAVGGDIPSERQRADLERAVDLILHKPVNVDLLRKFVSSTRVHSSFSGRVEGIDIIEYVQFVLLGGRKMILEVTSTLGTQGRLHVSAGRVTHAECGVLKGEQAFYRCVCFKEGTFRHLPWEEPDEGTISKPGEFLLMEAVRKRDDAWDQTAHTE